MIRSNAQSSSADPELQTLTSLIETATGDVFFTPAPQDEDLSVIAEHDDNEMSV